MRHSRINRWVPAPPNRKQKATAKRVVAEIAAEVSPEYAKWLTTLKNKRWAEGWAADHIALVEDPSAPPPGSI